VGLSLLNPTEAPTEAPTEKPTEAPTEAPTEEPTEPPTEAPTEPPEVRYTFTFVGDCTLGSNRDRWGYASSFIKTIGENYDYPFANVREFFENDDLTVANLEVVLADEGASTGKLFTFRGPTAYSQILTGSSVEAVTIANNHARDYGTAGYESTKSVLDAAGVSYVEVYSSTVIELEKGLTVGLYAIDGSVNAIDKNKAVAGVQKLKEEGVDLIIVAAHWGNEGKYRPNSSQQDIGKALIDAGANIIYGHHPHVLQKIEEYNGGIIYYSLGNFSFGGNTNPRDKDSVIVRQEVIHNPDGSVSLGELALIPCSISSVEDRNNYQPTPCEEGTEMYDRILSKLDGSFDGYDLVVDYSNLKTS
jgi:poly-gamma-glutamate synthesis protein (capsule biosynthesis protein)